MATVKKGFYYDHNIMLLQLQVKGDVSPFILGYKAS